MSLLHTVPLLLAVSLLFPASPATAQRAGSRSNAPTVPGVGNRRGNPEVVIEVTTAKGQGSPPTVLVELSQFGGSIVRSYADSSGRATFPNIAPGTYTATISGAGLESTTVNFTVEPGLRQTISAEVRSAPGEERAGPGGLVDATELSAPKNVRKEYDKGLKKFRDKKFEEAEKHFTKAVNEYPKLSSAWNNLGTIYMRKNDVPRASDCYRRALAENPNNTIAARNLALLLIMQSRPNDAEQIMRHAIVLEPTHSESLTLLAYAELMNGKFDEAIVTARKVHTGPKHINSLCHLVAARAFEAKKDNVDAIEEYKLFLKEVPNAPQVKIAQEALARLQSQQQTEAEHAEK